MIMAMSKLMILLLAPTCSVIADLKVSATRSVVADLKVSENYVFLCNLVKILQLCFSASF